MADAENTALADSPAAGRPTEQTAVPAAIEALKTESAAVSTASTPIPSIEEQALSLRVSLADLCAKGTAAYSHKEYEKATDFFARAAEMQAEMNGEMDPENAEILFLYGRSLFKVGQSKSDVLGGKAPVAEKPKPEKKEKKAPKGAAESSKSSADSEADKDAGKAQETKKPLFQFSGDENLVDDSDEDGEDGDEEGDEEEDDLGVAFEILDLARVLFVKRLEKAQEVREHTEDESEGTATEEGGGAATEEMSPEIKHVKERLADTHDLLTEISWENERHAQALNDARLSLKYKKELYSDDNEIVAEAHFKVSLALEFASVTQTEEDAERSNGVQEVDQAMRDEAAKELEEAIRCTKLNLDNKEVELATTHAPEENDVTRQRIAEVKELIADMEERLKDLRKPPIDLDAAIGAGIGAAGGLMGALAGESKADAEKRIEEAKKTATDLSGLVRKRAKEEPSAVTEKNGDAKTEGAAANGKRKLDETPEPDSKKAKVEDAAES